MCTKYPHKKNVCYGCIADVSISSNRGKELTSHCNLLEEYCSIDDYTCKTKVEN
jgi:hypothetical protein